MKSEKYEEWFNVAFDRAVSSSSLTSDESKRASWKKVQEQLEQVNHKRKRRRRIQLSGIVAASFLAGAILFSPPGVTKAISPIVKSVVDLGDGMISIIIRNGDTPQSLVTPKTENPEKTLGQENENDNFARLEWSEERKSESSPLQLEDAKSKLSFALPDITQVPPEYRFDSYTISYPSENGSKFDRISLKYVDKEKHNLWIDMMKLKTYQSTMTTVPKDTEMIQLGDDELYFSPGVYNQLIGMHQTVMIQIGSDLPKDELVRVYKDFLKIQ
ncbi:hypothetical protein GRF59_01900 [Paenibacillus sp. HJL G12]|uniref:DUF4367 domain-containing protein n=1 Tax=Paenibacillus dendrobii TaxID=2691084 RepID=A0A7X3IED4_9BACL|nr:hypothetical protein [Paenibacillus dendrobii]MWV42372.1 hypothetical protein [Paenibacillus dendrobii]